MQSLATPIPQRAIDKAEAASQVMEAIEQGIDYCQYRRDYRDKCYDILSIGEQDKVINSIDLLAQNLGREITVRIFSETISSFLASLEDEVSR